MGGRGREGGEAMSRSNVSAAQEHDTTIKVLRLAFFLASGHKISAVLCTNSFTYSSYHF